MLRGASIRPRCSSARDIRKRKRRWLRSAARLAAVNGTEGPKATCVLLRLIARRCCQCCQVLREGAEATNSELVDLPTPSATESTLKPKHIRACYTRRSLCGE